LAQSLNAKNQLERGFKSRMPSPGYCIGQLAEATDFSAVSGFTACWIVGLLVFGDRSGSGYAHGALLRQIPASVEAAKCRHCSRTHIAIHRATVLRRPGVKAQQQ